MMPILFMASLSLLSAAWRNHCNAAANSRAANAASPFLKSCWALPTDGWGELDGGSHLSEGDARSAGRGGAAPIAFADFPRWHLMETVDGRAISPTSAGDSCCSDRAVR